MRRIWFLLAFLGMTTMGMAQRLGYVDTQAILNAIPEYKQAQAEIERLSKRWEGEVASLFEDASALQAQLDAESVLLTPDMIAERKAAIQTTRDTARSRQMRYFSPEGQLFEKREELVAPVQALVAGAICATEWRLFLLRSCGQSGGFAFRGNPIPGVGFGRGR